jgi:hypothetical protein
VFARYFSLFAMTIMLAGSTAGHQEHKLNSVVTVSLCELLKNPLPYSGRNIVTTARISQFKEGTAIWDPTCSKLGADLHFPDAWRSSSSLLDLDNFLRSASMDYPIIAKLKGVWLPAQHTDDRFLAQPRNIFLVSEASNVGRSKTIEHR